MAQNRPYQEEDGLNQDDRSYDDMQKYQRVRQHKPPTLGKGCAFGKINLVAYNGDNQDEFNNQSPRDILEIALSHNFYHMPLTFLNHQTGIRIRWFFRADIYSVHFRLSLRFAIQFAMVPSWIERCVVLYQNVEDWELRGGGSKRFQRCILIDGQMRPRAGCQP